MRFQVQDLTVSRGGRRVLEAARFTLEGGDLAALRGPNGAGKTTLLRALAGLSRPEGGDVRVIGGAPDGETGQDDSVMGDSLMGEPERYRERVMIAGHLDAVKPTMTVVENLRFWAKFFGALDLDAEARLGAALERFGLDHLADMPAGACSAGQKRRLGLARLAVADRAIWLLDEPVVSLDTASVAAFDALVAAHCAGGGIVLAATHAAWPAAPTRTLQIEDYVAGRARAEAAAAAPGAPAPADDPFLDGDWRGV